MIKTSTFLILAMISASSWAYSPSQVQNSQTSKTAETENRFTLLHDLTSISLKDSRNRDWDGGYYTQNPMVNVGFENVNNSNIYSMKVSIIKCNGIVRADYTYKLLEDAVKDNSSDIDITHITCGETATFDVSIPGRYCLAYCATDEKNNPVVTGSIHFDSLYDDGNWTVCGEAEISSGVLSSCNLKSHVFSSNGTGILEEPGDLIWWECPVTYPYYSGETWSATIEYHPILKHYRIVNPFTCNPELKDYLPEDNELLSAFYSNVAYSPEAFLFDHNNPAWFLLNAESESYTYCEPMRTGIVALHRYNPYHYMAHPYNQNIGHVIYDVCPIQDIRKTGKYVDMPLEDEREASLIVKFSGWTTGVNEIYNDNDECKEFFTIDGVKVQTPAKGFYIVKQGSKSAKIII